MELISIKQIIDKNTLAINYQTASNKKRELKVYFDDPFSPVNTVDEKFYQKLEKSFLKIKKNNHLRQSKRYLK